MATLVVMAHGVGNETEGFETKWRELIEQTTSIPDDVVVKGLLWEDVLEQVAQKYPIISQQQASLLAMLNFPYLQQLLASDVYDLARDALMDVLVYAGLDDMWAYIQAECSAKLDRLRRDDNGRLLYLESDTLLIGHSLGAAMLPHLVWREAKNTGVIPYKGMILLATPLGIQSPIPRVFKDLLQRLGKIHGGSRTKTLQQFAKRWSMGGANRLRIINNENDIICSDVRFELPGGKLKDLIPLRQGFDPNEIAVLDKWHPGSIEYIAFGERKISSIAYNHAVFNYLQQPAFITAFNRMVHGGEQ
ncbi:hypothetical protein [Reinekea sp. G2M2-21]|uniref:hypothetical protein n=1 Tax=Reinekea sp. G2M2-21 TaxID=2788942 RepID=UPI0018AAFDE1|nr:hypothetical protein [Reinekea sp. G2M2-21]